MASNSKPNADWLQPPEEEEGLRRYVETIRERFWLIAITMLITTLAAVVYVVVAPKTYEASASLLVTPVSDSDPILTNLPLIHSTADPTRDVETASLLVTNTNTATLAKADLRSSDTPTELLGKVKAEPVAQSNFVSVTASAHSPEDARALANAFAKAAVDNQTSKLHTQIATELQTLSSTLTPGDASQLQTLAAAPTPDLRVETTAQLPTGPSSPKKKLSIAGGLIAGLVLGITGAFAAQALDPRLRRENQLRRLYSLPVLARVPEETRRRRGPLSPRTLSPVGAEAYRTLRSTLTSEHGEEKGATILVTGPSPGEGKSTTAINLAASLALTGKQVILIEADLRRPSLGAVFNVPASERGGVVSVLTEQKRLPSALVTAPILGDNLKLLLADHEGGWIAELFSIPAAGQMLDDAEALADYVIIDSPPLNAVVDSMPLARRADDVLIVVRLGKSDLKKIEQLGELLAENGVAPVGFAIVGTPRPSRSGYQYYDRPSDSADRIGTKRSLFGRLTRRD
jgi:capsular exopolysaccharide synthesis family protein